MIRGKGSSSYIMLDSAPLVPCFLVAPSARSVGVDCDGAGKGRGLGRIGFRASPLIVVGQASLLSHSRGVKFISRDGK
ncbi:hypothetical protein Tco_0911629 [Tanacetum coccineum]|uniref:Uncharacterized protein n=1 Tax=Tanacetum coccineum TaxID=301880 RepID=A0ABQ5CX66_9ASTR